MLVAANLVATVLRFVLLRSWVFSARRAAPLGRGGAMSSATGESAIVRPGGLGWDARARLRSLLRGRADDPAWVRPALGSLLVGTALLYLVGLGASGYANAFYSAAVEAATKSWKAFFFGSFDSSNFITVDKPPASLWVMDISARLFGVSSWSILVPQALEGVAAVGLLYATVRRRFPAPAALLAGLALALTPVAALMFRFNNPDALLTLAARRPPPTRSPARSSGASTRWLAAGRRAGRARLPDEDAAGVRRRPGLRRRLPARRADRRSAGGSSSCSSPASRSSSRRGWWVAIVALWPASSRPYIGGSQDNSILNLIFGYNGFGRITGNEAGSVVGGRTAPAAGGRHVGPDRHHAPLRRRDGHPDLLAAARRRCCWPWRCSGRRGGPPRTDGRRAAVLIWGSWLVVTGLVFSFAQGIIHPYYTVALAPAIGALVRHRRRLGLGRTGGAAAAAGAGGHARRHGRLGRSSCSSGRRPGSPGCASWCSWPGSSSAALVLVPPALWRRTRVPATLVRLPGARGRRWRHPPPTRCTPPRCRTRARCRPPGPPAPRSGRPGRPRRRWPSRLRRRPRLRPGGGGFPAGGRGFPRRGAAAGGSFGAPAQRGGPAPRHVDRPSRRPAPAAADSPPAASPAAGAGGALGGLLDAGTPSKALSSSSSTDAGELPLGRRRRRRQQRRRRPARRRRAGDGDRRLQRHRPDADARPRSSATSAPARSTTTSAEGAGGGQGSSSSAQAIASWVESHFTRPDGRRGDRLRPEQRRDLGLSVRRLSLRALPGRPRPSPARATRPRASSS